MYRFSNTNFYLGMRLGKTKYSNQDITYSVSGNPYVITNKGDISMLYGVLGGEHFFGNHFSIGGEFTLAKLKDNYSPGTPSTPGTLNIYSMTESSVMLRFYPF